MRESQHETMFCGMTHSTKFSWRKKIPVSSSSRTSMQRIEKGGSRCAKPRSGGFEQEVTNFRKSLRSSSLKSLFKISHNHWITRCESWKPPEYCVWRLRSLRSRGTLSPEINLWTWKCLSWSIKNSLAAEMRHKSEKDHILWVNNYWQV